MIDLQNPSRITLKQNQLLRIFPLAVTTLIREMDDITELAVRKIENLHVALLGQRELDSPDPGLERLFAIHESGIIGKLTALKALIQQEFPKFPGSLAQRLGVSRQVEHYENPQETIPAKV